MAETASAGSMQVSTLTGDTVARIAPGATLEQVADALAADGVGALVVGDGDTVDGIVSERDVIRALAGRSDLRTTHVMDVANTHLVWSDATASVGEVAMKMMDHYVRHVLLEDDGRLVGIVSARDLLGAYVSSDTRFSTDGW